MDQILFQWTGSENIDPESRGGSIDARKLAVLEAFMGYQWSSTVAYQGNYSNPNPGASVKLDSLYHEISAEVYGMLMAQTHFKDLLAMLTYTIDQDTQAMVVDSDSIAAMINQLDIEAANDPVYGQELWGEFFRTLYALNGYSDVISGSVSGDTAADTSEDTGNVSSLEALSAAAISSSALAASAGVESDTAALTADSEVSVTVCCSCTTCRPPSPPPSPDDQGTTVRRDPLVLDVTGFGIETTSINGSDTQDPTYFDYNSNGFAIQTGWVGPTNGFLVMDRNGNGYIDNGCELFSGYTLLSDGQMAQDGYEALADLDTNQDGKIDASDPAFSQLEIWQDVDANGFSAYWELHALSFYEITSIDVPTSLPPSNTTHADAQGNFLQVTSTYTKADGSIGQVAEYDFATNPTYSYSVQWTSVSDTIAPLPDLSGCGTLRTLHQSMAQDTSGQLESLVEQFVSATDVGLA